LIKKRDWSEKTMEYETIFLNNIVQLRIDAKTYSYYMLLIETLKRDSRPKFVKSHKTFEGISYEFTIDGDSFDVSFDENLDEVVFSAHKNSESALKSLIIKLGLE